MGMFRMHLCLLACFFAVVPLMADESAKDASDAAQPADDSVIPETVDLLDGAESAEGALKAFLAASKAADDKAALLMVDPPIRKLLIPEIAIERSATDSVVMELALFGKDNIPIGGMLFHFARRDLINIQTLEIVKTRVVDDDRVVFTVLSTSLSYHGPGKRSIVQDILTVQRSGKWYVFRPFGMLTHYVMGHEDFAIKSGTMIRLKKAAPDAPGQVDQVPETEYLVPIEAMHAELARSTESPLLTECLVLADRLHRLESSIANRAQRGEYKTRGELREAYGSQTKLLNDLHEKLRLTLQPAFDNLAKTYGIKSASSRSE